MGLLKWFTTGGEAVEKVTDAVINAGDALVYTDEEKEIDQQKRRELYFKFLELSRDESSIKSVTRRILAFAVFGHWFLFLDIAVICKLMSRDDMASFFFTMGADMMWIVGAVASFYFGTQFIKAHHKSKTS